MNDESRFGCPLIYITLRQKRDQGRRRLCDQTRLMVTVGLLDTGLVNPVRNSCLVKYSCTTSEFGGQASEMQKLAPR